MKKLSTNFKQRLIASALGILLLFMAVYFSVYGIFKVFFTSLTAAIIGTALWEFYTIAKGKGYAPLNKIGIVFTVLYVGAVFLSTQTPAAQALPVAVLGLTLVAAFLYYFQQGTDPFLNLSITMFGIFYLTLPLTCMININYFFPVDATQDGRWWLFYAIAVTKMTDVGAYFSGKLLGAHKLAPYISPKKTWEGSIGGLLASLATSVIFYTLSIFTPYSLNLSFGQSLLLGFFISLLAQFGDLAESLLKRDTGVKDSNQLPGFGGILDILDSLVFTVPFVYIFLKMTQA